MLGMSENARAPCTSVNSTLGGAEQITGTSDRGRKGRYIKRPEGRGARGSGPGRVPGDVFCAVDRVLVFPSALGKGVLGVSRGLRRPRIRHPPCL
jgi:hypothetical protein